MSIFLAYVAFTIAVFAVIVVSVAIVSETKADK